MDRLMPNLSIYLRSDAEAALNYLLEHWYEDEPDQRRKRNATIQRALIECARKEGLKVK